MREIEFAYRESCLIRDEEILREGKRLLPEIKKVKATVSSGYKTDYASVSLCSDSKILAEVEKTIKAKKKLKPHVLVVVGIGGSNLGTMAVHQSINGKRYNETNPPIHIYFADTIDTDKINRILSISEETLDKGENVLVNVVTKSGTTTETIALFELFYDQLKRHRKNYRDYVVATTDEGSKLWDVAGKEGFTRLKIPGKVGGRYSVFSAVGLFPLGMMGADIRKLQEGAASMLQKCTSEELLSNPAAVSAILLFLHKKAGRNINDNFFFSDDLEAVGKWYRQLMGESIGKEWDRSREKRVFEGITPTVSIGSTDLHSMAQLYLAGPQDKTTTFVKVGKNKKELALPEHSIFESLVESIQGRRLSTIMNAIYEGVKISYMEHGRPFTEIVLADKSEESVAALLQFKMVEIMYLAYLLGVNPFDQPNVEGYKVETRRILSGDE
ncbi:MAG: hypothetical protein ABH834_01235 [Candidatus Altiarchaeota archaeon]